jgi:hypothetical protein
MAEFCKQGSQKVYRKSKPVREHTHHAGSLYEATPEESSKTHQALSSFNHGDLQPWEDLESLLVASSCLLPVQYYDRVCRRRILGGEQKLMFAVLADALRCYVRFARSRDMQERRQLGELERWFRDNDQSGIFSFKSLCETFGIDANVLRNSLRIAQAHQKWGFRLSDWID